MQRSRPPAGTRRQPTAGDINRYAQKWLRAFTPFFTPTERRTASCQHRLFFAQVEYCDNLIFDRRAALDALGDRLLDANRTIGQPTTLATIFGRKVTKRCRGKLETVIEDLDLPNPVIRSYCRDGSVKQYVRDHLILRTEATSNNVRDFGVAKSIEQLPPLHKGPYAPDGTIHLQGAGCGTFDGAACTGTSHPVFWIAGREIGRRVRAPENRLAGIAGCVRCRGAWCSRPS